MSVSLREDRQAIKKTKVGVIKSLYRGQGSSARKRGHHLPTYSSQQLIDWAIAEPKFHIIYDNWVKANYDRYLRPSFDRKDNKKSYTLDNLQVITFMENCRKGGTIEADPAVKSIYQKTKKGILIAQWRSAADAEKLLGIDNGDIGKCCQGKRKQAGGYLWEFTESSLIGKCGVGLSNYEIAKRIGGVKFWCAKDDTLKDLVGLKGLKQIIDALATPTFSGEKEKETRVEEHEHNFIYIKETERYVCDKCGLKLSPTEQKEYCTCKDTGHYYKNGTITCNVCDKSQDKPIPAEKKEEETERILSKWEKKLGIKPQEQFYPDSTHPLPEPKPKDRIKEAKS
jgi:hypothetical protein